MISEWHPLGWWTVQPVWYHCLAHDRVGHPSWLPPDRIRNPRDPINWSLPHVLSALIFYVYGTLAETEELHREAFNEAFAAAALDWHWDEALRPIAGGERRQRADRALSASRRHFARPEHRAGGGTPADKTARYTARLSAGGITLRPGIQRVLAEANEAGLRLAIATTTSRPNVDALLAAAAPLPAFDVIAAGDDVPEKKPGRIFICWPYGRLAFQPRPAWQSRTPWMA